jgi:hypothetical protein
MVVPVTPREAHPAVLGRIDELVSFPDRADPFLDRWYQRFVGVADHRLRRRVLGSCLEECDDGTLLGAILQMERRAAAGDAGCRWMATELALTPSLLLELPYQRVLDLYVAARASGIEDLTRRFMGDRRPVDAATADDENPHLDAAAGVRTALARSRDRHVLDRLVHDRDPRVIAALLDNPRLTERDVIRLAALRPTNPDVLQLLAGDPRWASRYRVRKALAFNPYTPSQVARLLLPTLLRQDLVDLNGSHVLGPELRELVKKLLERRTTDRP